MCHLPDWNSAAHSGLVTRHPSCGTRAYFSYLAICFTHILPSQHDPEVVESALDDCLEELGLEYLDVSSFWNMNLDMMLLS